MADMFGFQNMDVSMELESLECGLDFDEINILDGLPSPPHSDNLHFGALASLLPHEQEQPGGAEMESPLNHSAAALPANNPDVTLAEAVAGDWKAQFQGSASVSASDVLPAIPVSHLPLGPTADVNVPTPPQPILMRPPTPTPTPTPTPNPPSTLEEWFSRGIAASLRPQPNHHGLLSSQHENIHTPQGMDVVGKEHETNNQMTLGKNMAAHNASRGINQHQLPSQQSSIQRNPVTERAVGITGTGTLTQGQLLSTKQPPTTRWNSRWSRYLKSPPRNAHDFRGVPSSLPYDTPAIHRPQQFHPLTPQGSLVPTTQHSFDLQNSIQPPCPTYSRPESSSNYQSPTAPVPPNTYDHQPTVSRLMLPEPAVSVRPTILSSNYQPQHGSSAITTFINSFGAGPSVPQRYPDIRDYQRNFLHSKQMMSHGGLAHQTLGLAPLSASPLVSDNSNEHNQLWSRPNVQGSSPFQGPPIMPKTSVSNIQSTMVVEPSQPVSTAPEASNPSSFLGFKTPELPSLPWIPNTNSSGNQPQNVAPASTDIFTANMNSGIFATPSSSTRPPISNRVRRILNLGTTPPKSPKPKAAPSSGKKAGTSQKSAPQTNAQQIQFPEFQDPVEKWIKELETELNRAWNQPQPAKKKAASRPARGSAGRREKGESSASKRRKSNSAEKEKEDARPVPNEAQKTHEYEVNVFQDHNAPEFYEQREVDNTAYDMHYQNVGVPMDPHIRFYRTAVRRNRG